MERITFKDFLSLGEGKEMKTLWSHSGIKFSRDKWKPISGKFVDKNADNMNYEEQEEEMTAGAVSDEDEFELDFDDDEIVLGDREPEGDDLEIDVDDDAPHISQKKSLNFNGDDFDGMDFDDDDDDYALPDPDSYDDKEVDDSWLDDPASEVPEIDLGDEDDEIPFDDDDDYALPAPEEYSHEQEEEYDDDDDSNFNGPGIKLIDLGDDYDDRYSRKTSDVPAYDRPAPKLSDFPDDDDEFKMKDIDFGFGNEEQEEDIDDEYSDEYDADTEEDYDEDRFDSDEEYGDEDFADDENVSEEDSDKQGVIRHVENAHLVYKRANENNTFDELWVYKIDKEGKTVRNDISIRKHILDGTDIMDSKMKSEDGSQQLEMKTIGDAQFIKITGLPN